MPLIDVEGRFPHAIRAPESLKVSVVLPVRNEHPQILSTILSVVEELEYWRYHYEVVVVSNQSDDGTPEILEDRFRHWIAEKRLKVVRFDERPACWHARNVGVEHATGEALIICDAHISVAVGTLHSMLQLWAKHGGLWHSASQMWGDQKNTRLYGYQLKVEEKFWGNLSRHIPPEVVDFGYPAYTVPMAQYSLFLMGRQEFLDVHGFHPRFKCYGGGEPYMAFRWWLLGKKCWMWPRGLMRHAFGLRQRWKSVDDPAKLRGSPYVKGKGPREKDVEAAKGDEVLHYSRGYSWNNDMLWYNFLLAAYVVGGEKWWLQRKGRYVEQCHGVERYLKKLEDLAAEARQDGEDERRWLLANQVMDFDTLIQEKPWDDFSR